MIYALYICSALTIWLFYQSYRSALNRRILLARGIVADGVIAEIRLEEKSNSDTGKTIVKVPYMQYTDKEGIKHKYQISTNSVFAPYNLNDEYKLVYDPEREYEPMIMTRFGIWGNVIGYAFCGLFMVFWIWWSSYGIWWT